MLYSESDEVIIAFEGAISTRVIHHPERAFAFEVLVHVDHPRLIALGPQKPPLHFHPYQEEYIQVLDGHLVLEVEGKGVLLHSGSGEVCIRPWLNHRLFPPRSDREGNIHSGESQATRFLLSGEESPRAFRLDKIFFENWYAYQDRVVVHGERLNILQVICSTPALLTFRFRGGLPFSRTIALVIGIVVGRWLAGLLGYKPYYRKWTKDWQLACEKMESSVSYRRAANRAKKE